MTKQELIKLQEMLEMLNALDKSEQTIIDKYKESKLVGKIYPIQYGAGGITFASEDGRSFYFMLNREYDENGIDKPRGPIQKYFIIDKKNDVWLNQEPKKLDYLFELLEREYTGY